MRYKSGNCLHGVALMPKLGDQGSAVLTSVSKEKGIIRFTTSSLPVDLPTYNVRMNSTLEIFVNDSSIW